MVLGVSIEDVMGEFHRYAKEKSLHPGGPERFPWRHPVMYWIVCDTRRAMYQRQLSEIEVEKHARKLLRDNETTQLKDLETTKGIIVSRPDLAPWKAAMGPAWEKVKVRVGADNFKRFMDIVEKSGR